MELQHFNSNVTGKAKTSGKSSRILQESQQKFEFCTVCDFFHKCVLTNKQIFSLRGKITNEYNVEVELIFANERIMKEFFSEIKQNSSLI